MLACDKCGTKIEDQGVPSVHVGTFIITLFLVDRDDNWNEVKDADLCEDCAALRFRSLIDKKLAHPKPKPASGKKRSKR